MLPNLHFGPKPGCASCTSIFEIFWHLVYFSNPSLQKYIIRILWMVPIYGIESWFALRNTDHAIYLQAFRDFYEAFVIWSFLQFLCKFLGNHDEEILNLLARKREPARMVIQASQKTRAVLQQSAVVGLLAA